MAHGLASLRFLFPILAPLPAAVKKKGPCKSLCAAPAKIALAFYLVKVYNVPNSKSEVLPMTPSNAHSFTAALGRTRFSVSGCFGVEQRAV
jgi:hypothetical protein